MWEGGPGRPEPRRVPTVDVHLVQSGAPARRARPGSTRRGAFRRPGGPRWVAFHDPRRIYFMEVTNDDTEKSMTPKKSVLLRVCERRGHTAQGTWQSTGLRLGAEGPGQRGPEPALWFLREGTGKAQGTSHSERSALACQSHSSGLRATGVSLGIWSLARVTSGRGSAGLCVRAGEGGGRGCGP